MTASAKRRLVACLPLLLAFAWMACDQRKDPYNVPAYFSFQVLPQTTDDTIQTTSIVHYAFVDTRIPLQGKLLVFLGGTNTTPHDYLSLCKSATSLGYHVINLYYPNAVNGEVCNSQSDPKCYVNYHEEVIFGGTQSSLVDVTKPNSITNRILKLLQRLHKLNRHNGWDQFYEGSELLYSKFVLSGHSQGGGHAAYLAQKFAVDRVVLFSSPDDYDDANKLPAAWCLKEFATSADKFYTLTHKRDEFMNISRQYAVWKGMGVLALSDTSSADSSNFGYYRALVTNFEPNSAAKTLPLYLYHNLTAREYALPAGDERKHLKEVWLHLLGSPDR